MVGKSVRIWSALVSVALVTLLSGAPGVAASSPMVVTNCANDAQLSSDIAAGGSITFNCGVATIVLSGAKTISNNVTINGGDKISLSGAGHHGLFNIGAAGASLDLQHIVLKKGSVSGNGGAINSQGGFLGLEYSTIKSSAATGNGGAIYTAGDIDMTGSTLSGNSALNGGAMYLTGTGNVTISTGSIHDNNPSTSTVSQNGGAIYVDSGATLNVYTSYIYNNVVGHDGIGAGLFNKGTATLSQTTFDSNSTGTSGEAGAIYNESSLTLTNDTLTRNTGYSFGGGLFNRSGTATLTNVTVAGNKEITDSGGGVLNYTGATMNLTNVLLANNSNDNCRFFSAATNLGGNLSTDNQCGFLSGRDSVAIKLGPLETNGGQTPTERLLPGSVAINDGTSSGSPPVLDQRGTTRPKGGMYDVGAVEFAPCSGAPTTKPTLLGPLSGATLTTTQPILDWYGPDCATKFEVVVRRGSPTGTIVVNKAVFPASQLKTSALAKGHTYYWLVKGCDSAGCIASDQSTFSL
jgi:predicted outer membrane repeat protein